MSEPIKYEIKSRHDGQVKKLNDEKQELESKTSKEQADLNQKIIKIQDNLDVSIQNEQSTKKELDEKNKMYEKSQQSLSAKVKEHEETQQKLSVEVKEHEEAKQKFETNLCSDNYNTLIKVFRNCIHFLFQVVEKSEDSYKNLLSLNDIMISKFSHQKPYEKLDVHKMNEDFDVNLPLSLPIKEIIKLKLLYVLSFYKHNHHKKEEKVDTQMTDSNNYDIYGVLSKALHMMYHELNEKSTYQESVDFVNQLLINDLHISYGIPEYLYQDFENNEDSKLLLILYILQNIDIDN